MNDSDNNNVISYHQKFAHMKDGVALFKRQNTAGYAGARLDLTYPSAYAYKHDIDFFFCGDYYYGDRNREDESQSLMEQKYLLVELLVEQNGKLFKARFYFKLLSGQTPIFEANILQSGVDSWNTNTAYKIKNYHGESFSHWHYFRIRADLSSGTGTPKLLSYQLGEKEVDLGNSWSFVEHDIATPAGSNTALSILSYCDNNPSTGRINRMYISHIRQWPDRGRGNDLFVNGKDFVS